MSHEIIDYIKKCQKMGVAEDLISQQLREVGWAEEDIAQAWETARKSSLVQKILSKISIPEFPKLPKRYLMGIGIGIVIILLGGYLVYAKYYLSPERIWDKALEKSRELTSGHVSIEGNYADQIPEETGTNEQSGDIFDSINEIKATISAEGGFVIQEKKRADFSLKSEANLKFGSFNFGFDAEERKIGKSLYYKMVNNPLFLLFGQTQSSANQQMEWLKADLQKPSTKISEEAVLKFKFLKEGRFLGKEKGTQGTLWHYQAQINKDELHSLLEKLIQPSDLEALMDKLEFKKVEVWINREEQQISQILIETTAPSLIAISLVEIEETRAKNRDAKRMTDIRQLQAALELFYSDNGRYPTATSGLPDAQDGAKSKVSQIMPSIPIAPTPADGDCTDDNNKYWYEQLEGGANYRLRFCLGEAVGEVGPGPVEASPQSLKNLEGDTPAPPKSNSFLAAPFTGTLSLRINLSKFNEPVTVEEPRGSSEANP